MILSVKKVVAMSIIVSLLGVAGTFGLKTLTSKEVTGPVEAETTYGPIKLTLRLDKNTFTLEEKVNVTVTITNISNETITLAYSQPPRTDFAAYDSSLQMIFFFARDGNMWPGVFVRMDLAPYESYGNTWKWGQKKAVGEHYELKLVAPGTYYIAGRTGPLLYYLGPKDEFREDEFHGIVTVETPKVEIQIF